MNPSTPRAGPPNDERHALFVRIAPFVAFMVLLQIRGWMEGGTAIDARWVYALNLPIVGGLLWWWWRQGAYDELRPTLSARDFLLAIAVGLAVFGLWIHADAPWMVIGEPAAGFIPQDKSGQLDWPLILARWTGAALVVPLMEELFWRGWLMRWLEAGRSRDFREVDPRTVGWLGVLGSTFAFVLVHPMWLGAVVAGLAYALLYRATGKLWTAVLAHAVTNGVLGIWVVAGRHWWFW